MRECASNFKSLLKNKLYLWIVGLSAVLSYGYFATHSTIGIDDTPFDLYFKDGLSVIVGRWVTYLLNKVVNIGEFSPYITDLCGVIILICAIFVWTALFMTIFGEKISKIGYAFAAAVFLTNPLHSEVYPYFLHNGVSIGFLTAGLSLVFFYSGIKVCEEEEANIRAILKYFMLSAVLMCVSMGCYESFTMVVILGFILILLSNCIAKEEYSTWKYLLVGVGISVLAVCLRSFIVSLFTLIFGLGDLQDAAVSRSVFEALDWIKSAEGRGEFKYSIKKMYALYFAFGIKYLPIAMFSLSSLIIFVSGIVYSFIKKKVKIFLFTIMGFCAAFLLFPVQGSVILYRSAQFVPVIGFFAALLVFVAFGEIRERIPEKIGNASFIALIVIFGITTFNQCADMNRWFYIDNMKYESAKTLVNNVYKDIAASHDTDKPVVFSGVYTIPKGIIADSYADYGSKDYYRIKFLTDWLDENLLDKFSDSYGLRIAQMPSLSVIDWARNAFLSDEELTRFAYLHGFNLVPNKDEDLYNRLEYETYDYPKYPKEGSIVETDDYIIVRF